MIIYWQCAIQSSFSLFLQISFLCVNLRCKKNFVNLKLRNLKNIYSQTYLIFIDFDTIKLGFIISPVQEAEKYLPIIVVSIFLGSQNNGWAVLITAFERDRENI